MYVSEIRWRHKLTLKWKAFKVNAPLTTSVYAKRVFYKISDAIWQGYR